MALDPDAEWGLMELLMAEMTDTGHIHLWLDTEDGLKRRNMPKPITRPGVKPEETTFGGSALPLDEMAKWLGWDQIL